MQKAGNSQRVKLAGLLGESRLYDLGRLDLVAETTLNAEAQNQITEFLLGLSRPEQAAALGLYGERLMSSANDLSRVIYSFTLYEKSPQGMLLRVQADNLNQPFDINQQTKLDLGSTAKLRTLVTYLEVIARLHQEFSGLEPAKLQEQARPRRDVLAQWVAEYLLTASDKSLTAILEAAMGRSYSASPEIFYTGGGQHVFANFNKDDNGRVMDVWEATRNSVNLVYIRLMRDIVQHYLERSPAAAASVLEDSGSPTRRIYLLKFIEKESGVFMRRFYQRYAQMNADAMMAELYQRARQNPRKFAALYRYLEPRAEMQDFVAKLRQQIPAAAGMSEAVLRKLFDQNGPAAYNLADRGYIAQVHPLELWLVSYLLTHPGASFDEAFKASARERVQVYDWLLATSRKNAQDIRIKSLLEVEAFNALHKDWKRLGYPFETLTPSYATAIGSSGDRPAALAELMGIIVNDGVRLPVTSLKSLRFAIGTPYETHFKPRLPQAEALFPKEVAQTLRRALGLVVESGTAMRLHGAIKYADGTPVPLGGKTGTGDHRFERFGPGGQLLESRVVNRTATLVFYLGDRHFGTFTALVPGEQAGQFQFTSSLIAQILKNLLPRLQASMFPETLKAAPVVAAPPAAPEAEAEAPAELPVPVLEPKAKPKRSREVREGTTREAQPTQPGGFPDSLDPVLPPAQAPAQ
jgi:membrane peptidoglycan carboxypeptidase